MTLRHSASLNAARRRNDMERIADVGLDVLVIGGGATGAGVALDAASRGLEVALVERCDLASGTSQWSSKLAHGGLRYLRHLQVGVAWESARERHVLMTRTAPHLVRPLPFLVPLDGTIEPAFGVLTEAGIRAGDAMRIASGTSGAVLPSPRRVSADAAVRWAPHLRRDGLRGGVLFWDGQIEDDARLVIAISRTAAAHGARIITHCEAEHVDGQRVQLRDTITGNRFEVRARHVVNATGVWADRIAPSVVLRPSKGSHVVIPSAVLGGPRCAVMVPVPHASARWVGATPTSDGLVIVGVTDDEYSGDVNARPEVTTAETAFMLEVLNRSFEPPLQTRDVVGGYGGLRPLLAGGSGGTADLSRRHAIVRDPATGVLTVVGGKLTTYRRMAQDTVDALLGPERRRCPTARLPLVGAAPRSVLQQLQAPRRLVRRYGIEALSLVRLGGDDASLLRPVAGGVRALPVELLFGVLHEGALTVDDLLDRRVRLDLVPEERDAATQAALDALDRAA